MHSQIPEVAFTGDTSGALFEQQDGNDDLYKARLLIIELTFVDDTVTLEQVSYNRVDSVHGSVSWLQKYSPGDCLLALLLFYWHNSGQHMMCNLAFRTCIRCVTFKQSEESRQGLDG